MATPAPVRDVLSSQGIEARLVPLGNILPSDNPRRKQPPASYIDELAGSIAKHGIIEPLILRPHPKHDDKLQLVAGAMRLQGATKAGLTLVPAVIRSYTDLDVLEVQLIENISRASMHPLDEGEAFNRLIDTKKHTAESLAKAIGKSVRWIHNRREFTKLIPSLKKAFLDEELSASHAELVARLEPADQQRIDNGTGEKNPWATERGGGLWRWDFLGDGDEAHRRSVRSLRDVNDWIERNVRLAITTEAVQNLLPEVEDVQMEAARENTRVLQIANASMLPQNPELKGRFEGVLTDRHWKRAGGKSACEFAEKGVIVFGEGQGEVLEVCVNKKACAKHWPDHQPAAVEKRRKANARQGRGEDDYAAQLARDREKGAAAAARWKQLHPVLMKALQAAVKKIPLKVPAPLMAVVLEKNELPPRTTASMLPLALVVQTITHDLRYASDTWPGHEEVCQAWAKRLGIDTKKIERELFTPAKGITDPADLKSAVKPAAAKHARKFTAAQRASLSRKARKRHLGKKR